jgi:PAS domain S-box-containing protein
MTELRLFPLLLLVFLSTVVSTLLVLYCVHYVRRYGRTTQVTTFAAVAVGIAVWSGFAVLQLAATSYELSFLAYQFLHVGAWGTPAAIALYAMTTGEARRWVTPLTATALAVVHVPLLVAVFLAPESLLVIDPHLDSVGAFSVVDHGNRPLYVAYLVWAYLLVVASLGYILFQTLARDRFGRTQALVVVVSVFVPAAVSVVQTTNLGGFETPGTILTPVSLAAGVSGLGYATFQYDTFDVKSRARSRTIERMQEGYLLVDDDGTVVDANATAAELLPVTEQLVGQDVEWLLPGYSGSTHTTADTPAATFETTVGGVDGEERVLEASVSRLRQQGTSVGELCVFRDVTARVASQREVERQRNSLELLNQVVRHDIRNDLQVVISWAQLLLDEDRVDEQGTDYLQRVLRGARSAVDLTVTARELSEAMLRTDADPEPFDLADVLQTEVAEAAESFEDATVRVEGELPAVTVAADDLLHSVFRNLLQNAVVHNDADDPEVTVSAAVGDEESGTDERGGSDTVRVRVADDGPGVPAAQRDEIFGRGEKGLDSEGTGIGLYLVRTLVESYDGSVWIEDNEPTGAVFVVELPVWDETDE